MKLYLHFEEEYVVTVVASFQNAKLSVAQLSKVIKQHLIKKGLSINADCDLCLFYKRILKQIEVKDNDLLYDHFHDLEDIKAKFVRSDKPKGKTKTNKKIERELNVKSEDLEVESMKNPKTVDDWLRLAEKWRSLKHYRNTLQILMALVESKNVSAKIYDDIVKIYLEVKRPQEAMKWIKKAESDLPIYSACMLRQAECHMAQNNPDKAIEILLNYSKDIRKEGTASMEQKHEVQLLLCKAYQMKDQNDMALVIIHGVINELQEKNGSNSLATIEYAKLTYDLNPVQAYQATKVLLQLFVSYRAEKLYQKAFTEICQKPGAFTYLYRALEGAANDAIALAFIANVVRYHGAISEAEVLFTKAMRLDPVCPRVLIDYVHLLEVLCDYDKAFKTILRFLKDKPVVSVGSLKNQDLLKCIDNKDLTSIYLYDSTASNEHKDLCDKLEDLSLYSPDVPHVYSEDDLHCLGIWFTLVKILYITGATVLLKPLITLLDPFHRNKDLHQTSLRNESAFYSCISKLCSLSQSDPQYAPKVPVSDCDEIIYMVGDSHCITPAWKTVTYQNKPHVIYPVLSTGTKIWHIRPESTFYPKANFINATAKIPTKSTVIFLLGEIDCREAIVSCYERCIYESIEECITNLLNIYIDVLNEMQSRNKWTVFVHPVPPVLDVTRDVVTKFNRMLDERLAQESNLYWLPLHSDLLSINGDKQTLQPSYEFDGTHLHPCYLNILQDRMSDVKL